MRRRFRSFDFGGFAVATCRDDLTAFEQLVLVLLWGMSDDAGRQPGDFRSLYAVCFPRLGPSLDEVQQAVLRLEEFGEIVRYEIKGRPYLQMKGWYDRESWQHASYRPEDESKSDFPAPPRGTMTVRRRKAGRPKKPSVDGDVKLGNKLPDKPPPNSAWAKAGSLSESLVVGIDKAPAVANAREGGDSTSSQNGNGKGPATIGAILAGLTKPTIPDAERRGVLAACGAILGLRDVDGRVRDETKAMERAVHDGNASAARIEQFVNGTVWSREPARIAYLTARKEKSV